MQLHSLRRWSVRSVAATLGALVSLVAVGDPAARAAAQSAAVTPSCTGSVTIAIAGYPAGSSFRFLIDGASQEYVGFDGSYAHTFNGVWPADTRDHTWQLTVFEGSTVASTSNGSLAACAVLHAGHAATGLAVDNNYSTTAPSVRELHGYRLRVQSDCNLVLYSDSGSALWSTRTDGRGIRCHLSMQTDGNLVLYSGTGRALWSTRTGGTGHSDRLVLQNDHNLVVYTATRRAVWSSHTAGR